MKLKLVEVNGKNYAEVQDDKPLVIDEDGKEIAFDIAHTRNTISKLNGEARGFRERAEELAAKYKPYEGLDPDEARKALELTANIDAGKLVAAGQVEEIKLAAKRAAEEQVASNAKSYVEKLKAAEKERDKYRDEYNSEKLGGAFSRSKFIADKATIPGDLMQARFGGSFRIEDGKPVAYDSQGNKIFSRSRAGEVADFDEALEALVDQYPYRDQILKGTGSTGSGARGVGGPGGSLTRAEFDKMNPAQQREAALSKRGIVD